MDHPQIRSSGNTAEMDSSLKVLKVPNLNSADGPKVARHLWKGNQTFSKSLRWWRNEKKFFWSVGSFSTKWIKPWLKNLQKQKKIDAPWQNDGWPFLRLKSKVFSLKVWADIGQPFPYFSITEDTNALLKWVDYILAQNAVFYTVITV